MSSAKSTRDAVFEALDAFLHSEATVEQIAYATDLPADRVRSTLYRWEDRVVCRMRRVPATRHDGTPTGGSAIVWRLLPWGKPTQADIQRGEELAREHGWE